MEGAEKTMLAVVGEGFGLKYCLGALSLTTGATYIKMPVNTIAAWRGWRGLCRRWLERVSA
jgi:hypothetical protein